MVHRVAIRAGTCIGCFRVTPVPDVYCTADCRSHYFDCVDLANDIGCPRCDEPMLLKPGLWPIAAGGGYYLYAYSYYSCPSGHTDNVIRRYPH